MFYPIWPGSQKEIAIPWSAEIPKRNRLVYIISIIYRHPIYEHYIILNL